MSAVSVVMPTRDRPRFVREALRSLAAQRFDDFEVIVSDNAVHAPCADVVEEIGDRRVRYIRPPAPMAMPDHWEWACAHARGDYVGVMIDKTVWLPSTLAVAVGAAESSGCDAVNWWNSVYAPVDEDVSIDSGLFLQLHDELAPPRAFDGREEAARAMAFAVRRGQEGTAYYRGKACFGLYRRDLVDAIRRRWGRVFAPVSPDYTSRVFAFAQARSMLDLGVALQLSFVTRESNGARFQRDPAWARAFLEESAPGLMDRLPIAGLFTSPHNVVAYDYLPAEEALGLRIDCVNLTLRAREDLALVGAWPDPRLRREQHRLLVEAERRAGIGPAARVRRALAQIERPRPPRPKDLLVHAGSVALRRFPALKQRLRPLARIGPGAVPPEPVSIASAIEQADARVAAEWPGSGMPAPVSLTLAD